MNKTAIKRFAIEARKKLMASVIDRAGLMGITPEECREAISTGTGFAVFKTTADTEVTLYGDEIKYRQKLVDEINLRGFESVVEEVTYTWFNRIIAIRFMEVNDYLPTRVRVLSSEKEGKIEPDLITLAPNVEMEFSDEEIEYILTAKSENKLDELFRMLFIKQCQELHKILPELFEKTNDYTEMLLNISFTNKDDVVRMLVDEVEEENFDLNAKDEEGNPIGQVEIIGWLYQYYNTELKDDTFALLKKNVKITKERIPAATQLFTPDWIVRYMVENSLGRLWIDHLRANDPTVDEKETAERFGWKYYLPEAEQEEQVNIQLAEIRTSYKDLKPTDILCIDPCMGSGHILVYMFDVLMDIYKSVGYSERDAAFEIVEHNIRGLDIDKRAYQLAYFAVMMKGRGYNRRFFRGVDICGADIKIIEPKVYAIEESNGINRKHLNYFGAVLDKEKKQDALKQMESLLNDLAYAKEYGSILDIESYDWNLLREFVSEENSAEQVSLETFNIDSTKKILQKIINIGETLGTKYYVVSTNPPYMAISSCSAKVSEYVKKKFPECKEDLYAVFIGKCGKMLTYGGLQAMITQHTWMFLSRSEKLRRNLRYRDMINMAHLGARAFEEIGGEVVQTTSFVYRNTHVNNYKGVYCRLVDPLTQQGKQDMFLAARERYVFNQNNFTKIPGEPLAYWISEAFINNFEKESFGDVLECRVGLDTGDNETYLRCWYEVGIDEIMFDACKIEDVHSNVKAKYVPHTKGGEFRKWYGNFCYVISFDEANYNKLLNSGNHLPSRQFYFKEGLSWTRVSSKFAVRYSPKGMVFNSACPTAFCNSRWLYYSLGLLNSKVVGRYLDLLSPTINFQAGDVGKVPFIKDEKEIDLIDKLVCENVNLSKEEWDSYETSWDFKRNPLVNNMDRCNILYELYESLYKEREKNFTCLRKNEEKLNEIFSRIYGLSNEIDSIVNDSDVTITKISKKAAMVELISYAVGCMFGRYSLDYSGLVYAGGEWNKEKYKTYIPTADGIISITDVEYFNDDICSRFVEFIKVTYGEETLEENLQFISNSLGCKGNTSREIIRNYFMNDFFKDHCNMYSVTGSGKRPIYWLFDSGKENAFKALIYIHRYNADTVGRVRINYLHEIQASIENTMITAQYTIDNSVSASEKSKATKQLAKLTKQLAETRLYDQALAHVANQRIEIDLDDGVKVNYEKFQGIEIAQEGKKPVKIDLLAKIK